MGDTDIEVHTKGIFPIDIHGNKQGVRPKDQSWGCLLYTSQVVTPTLLGELVFDVVGASIYQLLNPELTASWEKGLTLVAEGSITEDEYMQKLESFIRNRTGSVLRVNNSYALRNGFDAVAANYKTGSKKAEETKMQ